MEENKVQYGLCNVHVGLVTKNDEGKYQFSVPKEYPGAVRITLDPQGEQTAFPADNVTYYVTNSNNGYTGELEMAYLYDWFETEYLGARVSTDGMVIESADDKAKDMYMMFQFEGDVKATKHILYFMKCARPSLEGETVDGPVDPKTVSIPYTASPLKTENGNIVKAKVTASAKNYDTFFTTAPTLPTFEEAASRKK